MCGVRAGLSMPSGTDGPVAAGFSLRPRGRRLKPAATDLSARRLKPAATNPSVVGARIPVPSPDPGRPVIFLIDGYNLMHAVGMLRVGLPKKQLAPARTRFLDWLADAARGRPDTLKVVFDAVHGPAPSAEHGHRGVRVRFAFRQTADEQIFPGGTAFLCDAGFTGPHESVLGREIEPVVRRFRTCMPQRFAPLRDRRGTALVPKLPPQP